VIPDEDGMEWATQYDVGFGEVKEIFYHIELRLLNPLASTIHRL